MTVREIELLRNRMTEPNLKDVGTIESVAHNGVSPLMVPSRLGALLSKR